MGALVALAGVTLPLFAMNAVALIAAVESDARPSADDRYGPIDAGGGWRQRKNRRRRYVGVARDGSSVERRIRIDGPGVGAAAARREEHYVRAHHSPERDTSGRTRA